MKANTIAQAEASRRNGHKSQGPTTSEGKANSARNSFKHGLYSKHAVLDEEDAAALDSLRQDLRAEHQPVNIVEGMLVEELAMNYWSINRYRTLEVNAINNNAAFPTIIAIQRFLTSSQRAFHRVLKELQSSQKARGFVPQNAISQPDTTPETAPTASPAPSESTPEPQNWRELFDKLPPGAKKGMALYDEKHHERLTLAWYADEEAAAA